MRAGRLRRVEVAALTNDGSRDILQATETRRKRQLDRRRVCVLGSLGFAFGCGPALLFHDHRVGSVRDGNRRRDQRRGRGQLYNVQAFVNIRWGSFTISYLFSSSSFQPYLFSLLTIIRILYLLAQPQLQPFCLPLYLASKQTRLGMIMLLLI